jgi:Bacterial Ig-like domain (group 2)
VKLKASLCAVSLIILSACGGGGGGTSQQVGQFIDDPVGGLTYSCVSASQTITGTTDAQGNFNYIPGQTCSFKVGNVTLGTLANIPSDGKVTPQDVAGVARRATNAPSAVVIAQFLQSLNDGSTPGRIVIPPVTSSLFLNTQATSLSSSSGSISPSELRDLVETVGGKTLVSPTVATSALDAQISSGAVSASSGSVSSTAAPVLNSITVTSSKASNAAGLTEQFTATGYYSNGSSTNLTSTVSWSSSDSALVSVNASGLATGLKKGSATVTASLTPSGASSAIKGSTTQTTTDPVLQAIAVTNHANPPAGLTDQLIAIGTYSDGSTADLTSSVTWSSSNTDRLTVSTSGLATGKAVGTATVTASLTPSADATAVSGTFNESVLEPTPLNIAISYVTSGISSIQNKASTVLQAILSLSDSTTKTVSSLADWVVTTVSGGGSATVAVDKTANTATQTGSAAGFISTIANYLGLKSNALSLEIKPLPPAISGVAATGSAMMSANVTLTDATGKTLSIAALDDGSFKFDDLTGYTAPYQLSANVLMGEKNITHYSIVGATPASGNNTANINQLTSAVVALVAPTGVISDLTPAQLTAITPAQVDAAVSKITTVIAPVAANIKGVSNFNPITSSFSANGVGPDALLDHINVNIKSDGVNIANKMALTTASSDGTDSSTLGKGASSSPTPLASGESVDLSGVDSLVSQFKKCFAVPNTSRLTNKTPSSATLHADCQGIAMPTYLHNGNTFLSRWAGMLNTPYADASSKIFRPEMRLRLSTNPETIAVNFNMTDKEGNGYTMPEVIQKQSDGSWKLYGNQRKINAFIEANLNHYIDLTPNTSYNNVNLSRVDAGFRIYVDPRTSFNSGGDVTNRAIDLSKNDGTSTLSWTDIKNQTGGDTFIKCVVITGPGKLVGAKWMGFHPNGLLLKRSSGSTLQNYLAVDSVLPTAANTALTNAQIGSRVAYLNANNSNQDLCQDSGSPTPVLDSGGVTANSNSVYTMDLMPLKNQKNPLTGQTDVTIDGRDKRWNTGPNFARIAPDSDMQKVFDNNPKVTFYVIDTENKLRLKFDSRYLGNLPSVTEAQNLVTANKLSELSKNSISSYLDYTGGKNATTTVSMTWTNPENGFNTDTVGFYANVYQSTPGSGLRGPRSIITSNQTNIGTDGLWGSDSDLAGDLDALPGTNFYWRFANYNKAKDSSGNCTGNYLVSSLNVGVARAKTSLFNQDINGTWLGTDTQATACNKTSSITSNGVVSYPAATNNYLHREIWLRTYTSSNVRVYRYWAKKNIS